MRSARRAAPQAGSGHPRLEREWRFGSHSDASDVTITVLA